MPKRIRHVIVSVDSGLKKSINIHAAAAGMLSPR
jgi:hypothetical protein